MKDTLISIEDLSDSKEMLLMGPNRLLAAFTCIIALLLAAAGIWMGLSKIDVYITAAGMVRTNENASVLRVINGGKALRVNMFDGEAVSKGDVLLSFDQQALNAQREINSRDIETAQKDIEILKLYRSSINDLKNYLDGDPTDKGRAYSLKVDSFLLQRETALAQVSEDEKNNELQKAGAELKLNSARDALARLQSEQNWLQLYKQSLESGRDVISAVSGNNPYRANYISLYKKYAADLASLDADKSQAKTNLEKTTSLYEMGTVSRKELDDAQSALNDADNKIKAYRQAVLSDANSKLADVAISINSAQDAIKSAGQEIDLYSAAKTSPLMQVEQAKMNLLTQIDSEIQQKNDNMDALNANRESIDAQIGASELAAPITGILSMNVVINEGDTVPPGTEIGEITPPDSDSFRVSLQVSNKDIAGVTLEQPIKFKFLALPYQEYGMVDGYVSKISADSRVTQTGESYYAVEAVVENKPIKSYKGVDESIKVGMAVEGRIIKGHKSILRWLVEKIMSR